MALTKTYTKTPCALDRIIFDIQRNVNITLALNFSTTSLFGDQLTVGFLADQPDWSHVDSVVSAHTGIALPSNLTQAVSIASLPESEPFARPAYRTKRNATAALVTVTVNTSNTIDFLMTAERFVTGGALIVKNAELGDYITASVFDGYNGGVIPEAYRAALCEAWPVVGLYIEKEWIKKEDGVYSSHEINAYPLNAKISAGLLLRVTYFATAEGLDRVVALNYNLTKKL